MFRLGRVWAASALAALTVAAPAGLVARDGSSDVSSDVLQQLTLFAEYSAAAYCPNNINSTGTAVTCAVGNCPTVEKASTNTIDEFDEDHDYGDVAGFIAEDSTNKLIVVSFRGTTSVETWVANLDFGTTSLSDICDDCKAHGGFWKSWESVADSITSNVKSAKDKHSDYKLVFTGHSFGAAVATLGATALRKAGYEIDLYTYGSPRVGNEELAKYITSQGNYRTTHTNDVVPKVPPASFGFSHTSPEYWITNGNDETVKTSDIDVIEGVNSTGGNAESSGVSVSAHHWYLVAIDKCN